MTATQGVFVNPHQQRMVGVFGVMGLKRGPCPQGHLLQPAGRALSLAHLLQQVVWVSRLKHHAVDPMRHGRGQPALARNRYRTYLIFAAARIDGLSIRT